MRGTIPNGNAAAPTPRRIPLHSGTVLVQVRVTARLSRLIGNSGPGQKNIRSAWVG